MSPSPKNCLLSFFKNRNTCIQNPEIYSKDKNIHKKSQVSTQKIKYSEAEKALHKEYAVLRTWGQNTPETPLSSKALLEFWTENKDIYPKEWLMFLELLELMNSLDHPMRHEVRSTLESLRSQKELEQLISNGLKLLS